MLCYVKQADLQLFLLSLGVLQNLLSLSGEMQQMFQAVDDFQLIAGFFSNESTSSNSILTSAALGLHRLHP
jgi:hypothetical protein